MNIIIDLLLIILLSCIPACISYFLDFCIGRPGSDQPNTGAVFSKYSLWLAEKRLNSIQNSIESNRSILQALQQTFYSLVSNDDPLIRRDGISQLNTTILLEAQKHYTYEKAFGMCIVCTNFWISLFCSIAFYFTIPLGFINPLFLFPLITTFSHLLTRKL